MKNTSTLFLRCLLKRFIINRPSLDIGQPDGFYDVVEGLLNDIYHIASLLPRLDKEHTGMEHYLVMHFTNII